MRKPLRKKIWTLAIVIYGALDIVQELLDLGFTEFVGLPEGINDIILDPLIGVTQAIFFWYAGAISLKNCCALIVTFLTEEATGGGAPCWFMDVMYAQKNAPILEQQMGAAAIQARAQANLIAAEGDIATNLTLRHGVGDEPINVGNVRLPDNASFRPLNIKVNGKGIRPPSAA